MLLILFANGIHFSPYIVSGQQKNISPRVASQEPSPTPGPTGPGPGPAGSDSQPPLTSNPDSPTSNPGPGSWLLIPLVPVIGIVWWLFDTENPVPPPVEVSKATIATPENPIPVTVPCPILSLSCPPDVDQGAPITFHSSLSTPANVTYNWSVSAGTIISGQGTPSITVDTANLGGQTVTATLELGGLDLVCSKTASCSTGVRTPKPPPLKFDEFGNIRFNDEKARLDNYAIQLQNAPGAQGYIVAYGTCAYEAQARADRAKDYLIYSRGIDAGRLVTIDSGCRPELKVELWVVAPGATPPPVDVVNIISPCPQCKRSPQRPRERGRRMRSVGRS